MIDPIALTNDIVGNVSSLALPALLWALIYLLAWEQGPFATSIGFGRRTFWLLLPGALLASLVLLPIQPGANDWLAIPGVGIEESFPMYLLPPFGAGGGAVVAAEWVFPGGEGLALPAAYVAGTFGVLVGADVLREPPLYIAGGPAGLYAI